MTLSAENKKRFRAIGHGLKPIVTIASKGLNEGVSAELERALGDHELIKIKIAWEDRDERRSAVEEICLRHKAELVQATGKTALLYRPSPNPNPRTSNLQGA